MHEIGVVRSMVKTVTAFAEANQITDIAEIVVDVGELSLVIPKYVEDIYPHVVEDTFLKNTKLILNIVPGGQAHHPHRRPAAHLQRDPYSRVTHNIRPDIGNDVGSYIMRLFLFCVAAREVPLENVVRDGRDVDRRRGPDRQDIPRLINARGGDDHEQRGEDKLRENK